MTRCVCWEIKQWRKFNERRGLYFSSRFQWSGFGIDFEDVFNGFAIKCIISSSMNQRLMNILSIISGFELKDISCVESAIIGIFVL